METIRDIPENKVQSIVASYESEGFSTQVVKQPNGLYTIIATKKD